MYNYVLSHNMYIYVSTVRTTGVLVIFIHKELHTPFAIGSLQYIIFHFSNKLRKSKKKNERAGTV